MSDTQTLIRGQDMADAWAERLNVRNERLEINWELLKETICSNMPQVPLKDRMSGSLRELWPEFETFKHAVHTRFNKLCANGPDLLTNLHLVLLPDDKLKVVYEGLREYAEGEDIPEEQLTSFIRLLYKGKGDTLMLEKWRGLVNQSVLFKWVEFFPQEPFQAHLERWIRIFLPGIMAGFRKHFGARVAVDKGHARADLARMARRPTCFQDADVERAFPSIDRSAVLMTMLAMGMSPVFVMAQARLWGVIGFDEDTGECTSVESLEPRGLLAAPGTRYPAVKWKRGAMEGGKNGPFHWQVIGCLLARCLLNQLDKMILSLLIVADDIKIEHTPADAQKIAEVTVYVLYILGLIAAGDKWELYYLRPPNPSSPGSRDARKNVEVFRRDMCDVDGAINSIPLAIRVHHTPQNAIVDRATQAPVT
eukprot:gene7178-4684_t